MNEERLVVGKDHGYKSYFKWLKQSGHNSRALVPPEERYTINVGSLYSGVVKTHHNEWSEQFSCIT